MGSNKAKQDNMGPVDPRMMITLAMFTLMMGCLLLAVFASDYVPPFIYSRGFKSTTCVVQNTYISANICCQSDVTDISKCHDNYVYPCGVVSVKYQISGTPLVGNSLSDTVATLYDSTHSASIVSPIGQCSYHHCGTRTFAKRLEDVNSFLSQYNTTDQNVGCYYSEDETTVTLLTVTTGVQLMHYILWPTIMIIVGSVLWVVMYVYIKKRPPQHDDDEDDDGKSGSETTRALTAMTDTSESEHGDHADFNKNTANGKAHGAAPETPADVNLEDNPHVALYKVNEEDRKSARAKPTQPMTYSPGPKQSDYFKEVDKDNKEKSPPAFFRNTSNTSGASGGKTSVGGGSGGGKPDNFKRNNSTISTNSSAVKGTGAKGFNRNTSVSASLPEKSTVKKSTGNDLKMTAID